MICKKKIHFFIFDYESAYVSERYSPINFDKDCFATAKLLANDLKWSAKEFVEECVKAIAELHNTPADKRQVPKIVMLLDAAREYQRRANLLAPPPKKPQSEARH